MEDFSDITLRKNPVQSVVVKYYDENNAEQTMDAADYKLYKSVPAKLVFETSYQLYDRLDAVNVEITCGDEDALTPIKAGIMYMTTLQFWKREDNLPIPLPDQAYISMAKQLFYPFRLNYY